MKSFLQTITPHTWIGMFGVFAFGLLALLPQIVFAQTISGILYDMVLNLTGWFLYIGGALLDYGINSFVLNFGINFRTQGVGVAVNDLWVIVRDLFNILFIFGLIYIGFKMILNSDDSQTKKTLVSLIIAALLINFSLFITKFVVDFTNILASEVAVAGFQLVDEEGNAILTQSTGSGDRRSVAVGDTFFELMDITDDVLNPTVDTSTVTAWSYIFGVGIVNIIAAFAFGVGGIMLIIRFVALSVYMVLSPFMFLGMIFPGFSGMSRKYWSGFFKQAFYAPVYIVMIFFAATVMTNFFADGRGSMQNGGIGNFFGSNAVGSTAGSIGTEFGAGLGPFILTAAFLIAAVQVAGKLSADGSGIMARVGGSVQSRVRGAVRGGVRFGARNTVGWAARGTVGAGSNAIANSRAYRRLNTSLGTNALGRNLAAGMDASLAAGSRASIAGSRTVTEQREVIRARQNQINTQRDVTEREDGLNQNLENANANTGDTATERKTRQQSINALGATVAKMTDAEILNLDLDTLKDPAVAQHLTDGHIKALKESGIYDKDKIKGITNSRNAAAIDTLSETLDSNNATEKELNSTLDQLTQTIQRMPTERVQDLGIDKLKSQRVASNLSQKQIEDLENSGRYTATEIQEIKDAKKAATIAIVNGSAPELINNANGDHAAALSNRRERFFKGSAQDAGKLPAELFSNPIMAQYITPAALQQRVRNGLSGSEVQKIEDNINQHISATGDIKLKQMWNKWSNNTTEGARFNII